MNYEYNDREEDLLDFLSELGIDDYKKVNSTKQLRNIMISCPYAPYSQAHSYGDDKHPSLSILCEEDSPYLVNCFTCQAKHRSLVTLVKGVGQLNPYWLQFLPKAIELEKVSLEMKLERIGRKKRQVPVFRQGLDEELYQKFMPGSHKYLQERGILVQTAKTWEAAWDGEAIRATFPIRDYEGNLVGAVGRGIHPRIHPRYFFYWGDPSRTLFGEQFIDTSQKLVVVEGTLDAILVWQEIQKGGYPYSVVAVQGSKISDTHMSRMVKFADQVILALDNDLAGQAASAHIYRQIGRKVGIEFYKWDSDMKDPADDPERFMRGIKNTSMGRYF